MDKYIPFEKMSKKAKKEMAKVRRGSWGNINPVTQKPESPKAYNRKKTRRERDDHDGSLSFVSRDFEQVNGPIEIACIFA